MMFGAVGPSCVVDDSGMRCSSPLMRSGSIEVGDVLVEHRAKMVFAKDDVIEALAARTSMVFCSGGGLSLSLTLQLLKERNVDPILLPSASPLVLQQRVTPDHAKPDPVEVDLHSRLPSLLKRDSVNASEDVDTPWFAAQHEHPIRLREFSLVGDQRTKAETSKRSIESSGIVPARLDEHIDVLRQSSFNVVCEGVRANQKKPCVLRA
jgi:hypothetical protein